VGGFLTPIDRHIIIDNCRDIEAQMTGTPYSFVCIGRLGSVLADHAAFDVDQTNPGKLTVEQ
jgi:hypothetical protein